MWQSMNKLIEEARARALGLYGPILPRLEPGALLTALADALEGAERHRLGQADDYVMRLDALEVQYKDVIDLLRARIKELEDGAASADYGMAVGRAELDKAQAEVVKLGEALWELRNE